MESHSRSIAKALSYRLLGSISTGGIFYVMTGKLSLSIGAGALDVLVKLALYFLHERVWNHISYGRPKRPEFESGPTFPQYCIPENPPNPAS